MHIPDGFLSPPVWASLNVTSLLVLGRSVKAFSPSAERPGLTLPLAQVGSLGAFVFAAQMINFPVGPGVSGHLVGTALLNALLGPAAASLIMTAILIVQALLFQDGGVLALGANIFNLAIAGVLASEFAFRAFGGRRKMACFMGGLLGVLVGFCLVMTELALSGVAIAPQVWMLTGLFALVNGLAEGAITVGIMSFFGRVQPGLQPRVDPAQRGQLGWLGLAAVALAVVGVLWASPLPDLLDSAAEASGFAERARTLVATPMADYEWGSLQGAWLRKASAGLLGVAVVFAVSAAFSKLVSRKNA